MHNAKLGADLARILHSLLHARLSRRTEMGRSQQVIRNDDKSRSRSGLLSATANRLRDVTAGSVETAARVDIVEVVAKDVRHVVGFARINGQVFRERLDLKLESVRQL